MNVARILSIARQELEQADVVSTEASLRRNLYLSAARNFYNVAEAVDDKEIQSSLIYLSASAVQRANCIGLFHKVSSSSSVHVVGTIEGVNVKRYESRISNIATHQELKGIREV